MAISPETAEWVDRAEGDVRAIRKLDLAEDRLVMAFHAQQAVEKYLKAVLTESLVLFPKIHDLTALVVMCAGLDPEFNTIGAQAAALQPFAVDVRYPGPIPAEAAVAQAIKTMDAIRDLCRRKLGLPPG